VHLPPLRERPGMDKYLCQEFQRLGGAERAMILTDTALQELAGYHWPCNYRQLHSVLRRLVHLHAAGSAIKAADLPPEIRTHVGTVTAGPIPPACPATTLRGISDQTIERAIAESPNNISHAARSLGVH